MTHYLAYLFIPFQALPFACMGSGCKPRGMKSV